jgi:hypothetical protein
MVSKIKIDENIDAAEDNEIDEPLTKPWRKVISIILIVVAILLLVGLIVLAIIYLSHHSAQTTTIRDIFIIFMALESLVIGTALIILIIQVASLLNLVNNEIRPIISDAQETITTLKSTSIFLSDELVKPVIKLSSFLAGFKQIFNLFRLKRRK